MKQTEKQWVDEFKEFVQAEGVSVPQELSQKILDRIQKTMTPSPWLVFAKLLGIHSVVGTLSLAVCNQFGLNPFNTNFSLSDYAMKINHSFCMSFCGFLFIGLSVSLAFLFLKQEEILVLKKNSFVQIFSLSILSLVIFFAFGAEIVLSIGLLWMAGASIGGMTPVLIYKLKQLKT